MPTRKVTTNGWIYWLARHPVHGLILFDKHNQESVGEGSCRVFKFDGNGIHIEVLREKLQSETSADVNDGEAFSIIAAYAKYRKDRGLSQKAPGYTPDTALLANHRRYMEEQGRSYLGVRKVAKDFRRESRCWKCKNEIDSASNYECEACGWLICGCGACGCRSRK